MGIFDFLGGGDSSGGTSSGFLMPMAAQAMRYDPRSALIAQMLQTGQAQLNQPTYSPGAALAKALTTGLGGLSSAYLTNQYMDASKAAPAEIGKALSGGARSNPVNALITSSNPIAQQMGFSMLPAYYKPTVMSAGQQLRIPATGQELTANTAPLSEPGKIAADAANNPDLISTNAALKGAETGATATAQNKADLQYKPAIAGATANATAPIEMFKELFKPQVNRVTGAITIPGVDNPDMVQTIMSRFPGVTSKALLADPNVPSAPGATPRPGAPAPSASKPPAPSAAEMGVSSDRVSSPSGGPAAENPKEPVPVGTKNPIDEVPKVGLPTGEMPITPGTISPGRDPIAIKAGENAVDQAGKQYEEIADSAKAANQIKSQLGAMRSLLDQGRLITNAAGPVREEISGLLYAATGNNAALAQKITGIDPTAADVFNKESTRLGFNLARQLGAREAAQIVQGAIKANPNLAATAEGNKMVIDTLIKGAEHDIDAQKYADAWFQKNGHYVGAQGWFNQNHPVSEYTSKAIPFQIPRLADGSIDVSQLQPNVTYQGQKGIGIWNGHGFIPVKQ